MAALELVPRGSAALDAVVAVARDSGATQRRVSGVAAASAEPDARADAVMAAAAAHAAGPMSAAAVTASEPSARYLEGHSDGQGRKLLEHLSPSPAT